MLPTPAASNDTIPISSDHIFTTSTITSIAAELISISNDENNSNRDNNSFDNSMSPIPPNTSIRSENLVRRLDFSKYVKYVPKRGEIISKSPIQSFESDDEIFNFDDEENNELAEKFALRKLDFSKYARKKVHIHSSPRQITKIKNEENKEAEFGEIEICISSPIRMTEQHAGWILNRMVSLFDARASSLDPLLLIYHHLKKNDRFNCKYVSIVLTKQDNFGEAKEWKLSMNVHGLNIQVANEIRNNLIEIATIVTVHSYEPMGWKGSIAFWRS